MTSISVAVSLSVSAAIQISFPSLHSKSTCGKRDTFTIVSGKTDAKANGAGAIHWLKTLMYTTIHVSYTFMRMRRPFEKAFLL